MKLAFIFLVILLSFSFAEASWTTCYNRANNSLFFNLNSHARPQKTCKTATGFKGEAGTVLINRTNSSEKNAFGLPKSGTRRIVQLDRGRQVLAAQWSRLGVSNSITILQPNFRSQSVRKICSIENYSDRFKTRYNKSKRRLYVLVTQPTNPSETKFKKVWKSCRI